LFPPSANALIFATLASAENEAFADAGLQMPYLINPELD
jgi:hypothetical protein